MRTPWILAVSALLACSADDPSGGTSGDVGTPVDTDTLTTDTAGPGDTDTIATTDTYTPPFELHGTVPPVALPAPEFTEVVNMDVTLRSQADLLGHPTVMWFYPAAGTSG